MARYHEEYGGVRRSRGSRRVPQVRERGWRSDYGYGSWGDRGELGYGEPYARGRGYGGEYRRWPSGGARMPRKPARGFPVRGYHTYDLDYGGQVGGPTTDYSGRAGYPAEDGRWSEYGGRGRYTPSLAEIGRRARRWRALYGELPPEYPGRWRGGGRPR